jgi:hypothetical protein
MPRSDPSSPAPGSQPSRGPSRLQMVLVVAAVGAATLGGLLLQGWVSALLLGLVVLALAALTLATWHRLTVPGRALRVIVLGLLAATAAARFDLT